MAHPTHAHRRTMLQAAAAGGICWLTPLAEMLARASEPGSGGKRAGRESRGRKGRPRSVIVLWLQGGPSQLETFDPHEGTRIAAGTRSCETAVKGIRLAEGLERTAAEMQSISLVRSLISKEGDHERATYHVKNGFRPDPTLVHPSLGSVLCHMLSDNVEIPRHVSILPGQWPARGGYLGDRYDAFKVGDPSQPVPDVRARTGEDRHLRRLEDLRDIVEPAFAASRLQQLDDRRTLHQHSIGRAVRMMSSEQLSAFDVSSEPAEVRAAYGDTPFGRGALAAVRLIEVGVRCVEVTLNGWDSHVNNHSIQSSLVQTLDPAFAALVADLRRRDLLDETVVLCGGEFGRTPSLNRAEGRDHWPHGFSIALAGGGIAGGRVVGETSPEPRLDASDLTQNVAEPRTVADVHATILHALGIDHHQELMTPVGRPMKLSEGQVIQDLLA
ncbi:DUF1501 domain-containing protein [Candidatus Laterigemmans baculatus]|uniref:DUF1501 domain-containing protein n=1 Tax=Candidatus Laterigemmans baculatus TaxID=2770505 RepID=UPI0013DA13D9|nr:DUF1501 domain-containing protein [Candidatus Laterigemmans baculatus]